VKRAVIGPAGVADAGAVTELVALGWVIYETGLGDAA
jgi:hypothetical protein